MARHGWRAAPGNGRRGDRHSDAGLRFGGQPRPSFGDAGERSRQVTVHVLDSYDPARPAPRVVALHGYTSNATEPQTYRRRDPYPYGTTDDRGDHFGNATDACCALSCEDGPG